MAKSFYDASWQLKFACTGYNGGHGNGSQEDVRKALFELLRYCEDVRMPDGKQVGKFETVDELSDFLDNCPDEAIDHLLIREYADGEAQVIPINRAGNVHSYEGKTISPEAYLNEYAPDEYSAGAVRKPGRWDNFCDFVRSIFGGRDPVVKAYEDHQARRTAYLNERGFGSGGAAKVTEDDVKIEAAEESELYEDKYFTEDLAPNEEPEFGDKDREMNKIRDILRPETFGYKPGTEVSNKMYTNMYGIANGDMPQELTGTLLGKEFEAYRHFAQTMMDLAGDDKKMRDAIVMLNQSGTLGKVYQSYKREYEDGKVLEIDKIMKDAIFGKNKGDLVKVINNERVAGRTHEISNMNH